MYFIRVCKFSSFISISYLQINKSPSQSQPLSLAQVIHVLQCFSTLCVEVTLLPRVSPRVSITWTVSHVSRGSGQALSMASLLQLLLLVLLLQVKHVTSTKEKEIRMRSNLGKMSLNPYFINNTISWRVLNDPY